MIDAEWAALQAAWIELEPAREDVEAVLRQTLARHRRAARIYTALDIVASIAFCSAGVIAIVRSPTWPVVAWTAGIFVFSASLLAVAIWSRRDVLVASAQPTVDFVASLRLRLDRRVRLSRWIALFAILEVVYGLVIYAVWSPDRLVLAAALYAGVIAMLLVYWRRYRGELARERSRLDALDAGLSP